MLVFLICVVILMYLMNCSLAFDLSLVLQWMVWVRWAHCMTVQTLGIEVVRDHLSSPRCTTTWMKTWAPSAASLNTSGRTNPDVVPTIEGAHVRWKTWTILATITETEMTIHPLAETVGLGAAGEGKCIITMRTQFSIKSKLVIVHKIWKNQLYSRLVRTMNGAAVEEVTTASLTTAGTATTRPVPAVATPSVGSASRAAAVVAETIFRIWNTTAAAEAGTRTTTASCGRPWRRKRWASSRGPAAESV